MSNRGVETRRRDAPGSMTPAGGENSSVNSAPTPMAVSLSRIVHLIRKEFIHMVRNRQNFRVMLIAPVFQLLLFGYAVQLDVKDVATVVADMDRSVSSRNLIEAFSRSGYFTITKHLSSYDEADVFLDKGHAKTAILIPPDFERRIKGLRTAYVGILIDGVDTTTASTVAGYAEAIVQRFSLENMQVRIEWARALRHSFEQPRLIVPSMEPAPRAWFNPNLNSRDYYVPATLVLILFFVGLTVTSMIIVREKETGTIEQLMVTPISRVELILGKTIPCFIICVFNLMTLTTLAFVWFQPIFNGSLLLFISAALIFIFTCLGMGMTISVFCRTQQQAILSSFMVLQPCVLLSGFVFPIENMPEPIQYLTYVNPLRYFLVIVRQVFLKGVGLDILWPQFIPLVIIGITMLTLASILFRKKVD
ncbi:ABC transporter permease [Thermodesulfobacteriota bacterium]